MIARRVHNIVGAIYMIPLWSISDELRIGPSVVMALPQQSNQALLSSRALRRSHLREQFFLETLGPEGPLTLPGSGK